VTLTAAGDLIAWGGACEGTTGPSCSLAPEGDESVTAEFSDLE
jgi:hypothetical protein